MRVQMTVLIAGLMCFGGCTHYFPAAVSSTALGEREKPIRVVTGKSSAYYVLGIGPSGNDSLAAALEDAKLQGGGDTMVNVFIDRSEFCFPFTILCVISRIDTDITGTLIRYENLPVSMPSLTVGDHVMVSMKDGRILRGPFEKYENGELCLNASSKEQPQCISFELIKGVFMIPDRLKNSSGNGGLM